MAIKHATVKAPGNTLAAVADWNANHVVDGNTGEVLFLTAGGNVGADSNLLWDDVNKRLGIGTITPSEKLNILGNLKVEKIYGPESLNEPDFTTHVKWDIIQDFDDTGGNATYLKNTGVGLVYQDVGNMAIPLVGNKWYKFVYTVSNVTEVGTLTSSIFGWTTDGVYPLDLSVGTHTLYFLTNAAPTAFAILGTSDTAGDGFTLDDFSLAMEVGGGDITGATIIGANVTSGEDPGHSHTAVPSHTIASHSDTTATGAELETLTDDSMADALHRHSELSASDGTPDQAVVVDGIGNVGIGVTTPNNKLHIHETTSAPSFIQYTNVTSGTGVVDGSFMGLDSDMTFVLAQFENAPIAFLTAGTPKMLIENGGNVGIGTPTPAASAILDLTSTTGALLVPRMTTIQKNALTALNGMILYDTDLNKFQGYENGVWTNLI